jgi:PAS domain S-box-containing protein
MIAYWDSSLRCCFISRAVERWFGVTPEEVTGKRVAELLGPEDYLLIHPYLERALRGEAQEFGRDIRDPTSGFVRHGMATYIPHVSDGQVRGVFTMFHDVTSAHRTRQALEATNERLRESEERFRLTIDEAPIGMALVDLEGRGLRANRVLCELLGYGAEELRELHFKEFTHPEDVDADLALLAQLAAGVIPRYQLGKRYLRKDGTVVDAMLSVSVVRAPDGAPRYYIAQVEDVTERRRLEREQEFLAEVGPVLDRSLHYDETLRAVAELPVRRLADVCIVELVEAGERRIHIACREPTRPEVREWVEHLRGPNGSPLLHPLLASRQSVVLGPSEAVAALSRGGDHLRALMDAHVRGMIASPLLAHTKLLGGIAFVALSPSPGYAGRDVRLVEEFAQRAALAIENARLYREARQATQARDDVLGMVAHDLRNPLNSILLQTAQLRSLGEAGPSAWERFERPAQRMNRLIKDLLDVTRMEAGRLTVEQVRLQPAQVVQESVESQRAFAATTSIELCSDCAAGLPDIWADHERLLQVFENLIGNSLKFTEPGGRITVGAVLDGVVVLFCVSDSGTGIAAEHMPHLFDRFWQAGKAERRGAGLGLPIVKGLIQAHGGRIWIESVVGEGTRVFFTLPVAPRHEEQDHRGPS